MKCKLKIKNKEARYPPPQFWGSHNPMQAPPPQGGWKTIVSFPRYDVALVKISEWSVKLFSSYRPKINLAWQWQTHQGEMP